MTYDDENWRTARSNLKTDISDARLPEMREAVIKLLYMVIDLETAVYGREVRQGYTNEGASVVAAHLRQRVQLLSFAARFAMLLRRYVSFGMNREEGALLKEFDDWVEANAFSGCLADVPRAAREERNVKKRAKKTTTIPEAIEHGPRTACYDNATVPGQQTPTIFCLCGERVYGDTWEDAGFELDMHLVESR